MRRVTAILAGACAALAIAAAPAAAEPFGFSHFDLAFTNEDGTTATQAGSHPFAMTVSLEGNLGDDALPEGWLRDFIAYQPPGFSGDNTAYPRCTTEDFLRTEGGRNACPLETTVGINAVSTQPGLWYSAPVFNLAPPPGVVARLGFRAVVMNIVIDVTVEPERPHRIIGASRNTPQLAHVFANKLQLWGDPSDPAHDELRGPFCGASIYEGLSPDVREFEFKTDTPGIKCPVEPNPRPFLTLPTNCSGVLASEFEARAWNDIDGDGRAERDSGTALVRDVAGQPQPFTGCGKLAFEPEIDARPTSRAAQSPTGLDLALEIDDEGLVSTGGLSQSQIRKVVLELPEGMTANPSLAEGLEVCSEGDLSRETLRSDPGEGCPEASKIGTIEVQTPLLAQTVNGELYVAEPFDNLAGDSLIALYIVLKAPELGIIIKQAVRVEPDPETGRLISITDEIPQLPFSSFRLKFREGGRSPLVTPPACGSHEATATFTPWSGTPEARSSSSFRIVSGPNEGPCPPGGTPPFEPGFAAGSLNNAAGAFSPFFMRLTRRDGDQDLVRFDAKLPQGVLARLAGVSRCPDAQIALAKAKTGKAELRSPSCPANSQIGRVQAGAGVGSQLTYVPGSVYLAGPFGGAPLSVVAIVPAVAGPFDVGTVVTRQALVVDPRTGEVTADGSLSDPIPHILAGIPLVVRDIQVHIDRPGFTLNPTGCDAMATVAGIWGGGAHPFSLLDDRAVPRAAPYQAASCERLPFKPRLGLRLKGGTGRGAHPALRTVFRPRPGHANSERVVVRFPRSAFVEQAHIRTVCTRVQFAADACPKGSVYGRVAAFTPLLANPLRGPVYLRSSDNLLPDLVFDLKGEVDFEAVARIDSVRGSLRAIAYGIPDAPIERVVIQMQGGRKSLIVNSRNLCAGKNRAKVRFDGHNAKRSQINPAVRAQCGKGRGRRANLSSARAAG